MIEPQTMKVLEIKAVNKFTNCFIAPDIPAREAMIIDVNNINIGFKSKKDFTGE